MAIMACALVLSASGFLAARWMLGASADEKPAAPAAAASDARAGLLRDWPKPDVTVVLSAQQHGYVQPCGCSPIQLGGLSRRFNVMQDLRKRGWEVVAGDLGDIAQDNAQSNALLQTLPAQTRLKYKYSMLALQQLKYGGVGIGANEMSTPLIEYLAEFSLNERSPRVLSANLKDKESKFPEMVGSTIVSAAKEGTPKVGFAGVVGPSVAKLSQDPDARFEAEGKVLPGALAELKKQGAQLLVLLYQGSQEEAKACAKQFPQFQIILCLNKEEEPSGRPDQVGNSLVIAVGHKGRYVGVVGAYGGNAGQPFQLRYELVAIGPEFETPEGQDKDNPIHALLQNYAEEVKKGNYLAQYNHTNKHPVQVDFPGATYVGSEKCQECHKAEYAIWLASPHPHAYETLVNKAKRPNLRQYDGECVVCHVTGFGNAGGFVDENRTPQFKGVGCESCHGPASLHVANRKDVKARAALNPWKGNTNQINFSCQKCHDPDNSVNFKFEKYWVEMKIQH
jgi:hypothetical protein